VHQFDKKTSDIDLLIDWNQKHSLFDYIELQQKLEDFLNVKIDLVVEKDLHWYIKDRIVNEAVSL
jgi:predicted nucleotidyltransferase